MERNYKTVFLCLDNDATYQAIKLQIEWRDKIRGLRIVGLPKDIKNMSEQELDTFMLRLV